MVTGKYTEKDIERKNKRYNEKMGKRRDIWR